MTTPILDLATLIERPIISIDGHDYALLSHDELSVVDLHRLQTSGRRIDALMEKDDELSEGDARELARLVRETSDRVMIGVPEDVRAKLGDSHRLAVLEVFTKLPLRRTATTAAGATARSTGVKSPPDSNGSTAARPVGGSKKPRRPS